MAIVLLFIATEAQAISYQAVADSLMGQLKYQKTADDSLKMLYDIFDASDQKNKLQPGKMVLDLAKRTNNQIALLDFIPQVTTLVANDTLQINEMLDYTNYLENKDIAKTVRVFILVQRASRESNYLSDKDLRETLKKYTKEYDNHGDDMYDEILDLYRMVLFLGNRNRGNLYLEYMTRLEDLIAKMPLDTSYILSLYYTTAANCHTRNGNHAKAIEMDRKLLETIQYLENRYKKMGRKYRDYHRYYYICYRRMLCNYEALSLDEIKSLYDKCVLLAEKDPEIARDFYEEGRPTIFRNMAEGNYAAVVPLIKKALPKIKDNAIRTKMLGMLVAAADSINDKATLLSALKDYNKMLSDRVAEQSADAYRELQIRYDVNHLKNEKEKLALEKKEAEVASGQKVMAVALAAVLILAVLLMFLYRSNFKLKRRIRETKDENQRLQTTLDDMMGEAAVLHGTLDVRQGSSATKNTNKGDKK